MLAFTLSHGRISVLLKAALIACLLYIFLSQAGILPYSTLQNQVNSISPDSVETYEEGIPRKLWQTWHTPAALLTDEGKELVRTWHEKNPDYQYELVTDQGAESYVQQHFALDSLIRDTFLNLKDSILRADFLRYLLLLADGGVYADLDVECREPINLWIPPEFQGKANVVLGIESDRAPVENDVKLYYDHRPHIWGITNWTFMAQGGHPLFRHVAETVARNLRAFANKQGRSLSTMELSYKEVIDATGPRAFTEAFLAYASKATGTMVTYANATMLEEPRLIGDILILPIRAFSTSEASRSGGEGAHSYDWPTLVYHWSKGTWKKTHFQKAENETMS